MKSLFAIMLILACLPVNLSAQRQKMKLNSSSVDWNTLDTEGELDSAWRVLMDESLEQYLNKSEEELNKKKHRTNLGMLSDKEAAKLVHKPYDLNKSKWNVQYFEKSKIIEEYLHSDLCSCEIENDTISIHLGSEYLSIGNDIQLILTEGKVKSVLFKEKYHYKEFDKSRIKWKDIPSTKPKVSYVPIKKFKLSYKQKPNWNLNETIEGYFQLRTKPFVPVDKYMAGDTKYICKASITFRCELKQVVRYVE